MTYILYDDIGMKVLTEKDEKTRKILEKKLELYMLKAQCDRKKKKNGNSKASHEIYC